MPRQVAIAAHQQAKTLVEQAHDLVDRKHRNSRGRELQRQRDAVEPDADRGDRAGTLLLQVEVRPVLARPIDEQLHCVRARNRRRIGLRVGQRQHAQRIDALGADAQWLPAGGDDAHVGRFAQQGVHQVGAGAQHVLAVVEDQQQLLPAQVVAQGLLQRLARGFLDAEHLRQRAAHQRRIEQRGEVDEPDAVPKGIEHFGGSLQCQPRLADAAGSRQRQQSRRRQQPLEFGDLPLAADEGREHLRQVGARPIERRRRFRCPAGVRHHRPDKAVATARERLDPAVAARHPCERTANRRDLHGEIGFLHDQPRPRGIHDVRLRHMLAGAAHQCGQHRDAPRPERHWRTVMGQHARVRVEPQRADLVDVPHFISTASAVNVASFF